MSVMSATGPGEASVLVVEDERDPARMVTAYLQRAGYRVSQVHTGPEAVATARGAEAGRRRRGRRAAGLDGIEVCRQIRTFSDCYLLMLTARDDEVDKLVGLSVGADDNITKPFSPRELVARVQTVLRRPRGASGAAGAAGAAGADEPEPVFGPLRVDVAGEPVDLTRTEFDLLAVVSASPRLAFARRQLIDQVWDRAWVGDEHLVYVHMRICRASWATTRPRRATSTRSAASATGWDRMSPLHVPDGEGRRLGARLLLLGQGVVVLAALLTAALVAALVGPPLFHQHLIEAGHPPDAPELVHIEEAYTSASAVSLGMAC